jgi:integrase
MTVRLRGTCKTKHRHTAECKTYHFDICIRRKRYRGALPEARTKKAADEAETKIRQEIFDKKFGLVETGTMTFKKYFEEIALPYAKTNLRSWKNWDYNQPVIIKALGDKELRDVCPLDIERLKSSLAKTKTKHGEPRQPASINRVLEIVSRCFTLAMKLGKASENPCSQVQKFRLDNERFRYLAPDEQATLLSKCTTRLTHLVPLIVISLATGLRKQELLKLKRNQVDFFRGHVIAIKTKGGRNREIPFSIFGDDARKALSAACHGKKGEQYLFLNKKTGRPYTDVKHAFTTACSNAGIEGLVWHDLRATFATRLAELGYQPFLIRDLLGHRELKTTEKYVRAAQLKKMVGMQESAQLRHNNVTSGNFEGSGQNESLAVNS